MNVVECSFNRHGQAILDIVNDAILTSTALYDYKPSTLRKMEAWFDAKQKGNFPVIGIESNDGQLLAFGSFGTFRAWPAYKYTAEHSIYVHQDHRRRGLGKMLLPLIIDRAIQKDLHVLIGAIDAKNASSIGLHKMFGFEHCGTIRQAGFKFGGWLDLEFYQLILSTPATPVDG